MNQWIFYGIVIGLGLMVVVPPVLFLRFYRRRGRTIRHQRPDSPPKP